MEIHTATRTSFWRIVGGWRKLSSLMKKCRLSACLPLTNEHLHLDIFSSAKLSSLLVTETMAMVQGVSSSHGHNPTRNLQTGDMAPSTQQMATSPRWRQSNGVSRLHSYNHMQVTVFFNYVHDHWSWPAVCWYCRLARHQSGARTRAIASRFCSWLTLSNKNWWESHDKFKNPMESSTVLSSERPTHGPLGQSS